ncbi:hypothetical protein HPB47_022511, partial [Ixodes persulcatus]
VDLTEFNKLKKSVEDLKPDELAKQVSQALDPTARKEAFLRDVGEKVEALKRKLTDTGAKLTDISAKLDPTTHLTPSMFNHEASGVRNTIATAKPYVAYYNYATLAIAAVLAFVLLAYVLGLTWGGCGSRDGSCSRGSGGSWLSAGGTIFILAFFIPMLVSTVFFAVGIVGQRSTCDLALDLGSPEAESLIRFAYERALPEKEGPKRGGVEYINADVVELVVNMTRSATKNGGGGGGGGISFELLLDDGKRLDFDAETKAFMDEVRKLNFRDVVSKELDEKLENVEKIDLEAVLNKIVDYKAKVAGMLDDVIQQLDRIKDNIGEIEDSKVFAKEKIDQIKTTLDEITLNVTNKAELYKDKFVEFANVYVNHTRGQVKEHVGDCRPAYAVYQASVNAVCSNVLLPFNGYWFSVGAFMVIGVPALILALCLASLYHRVDPSLAILESLSRGDSDHVSGGSYMDSDTIPLARPEYRDHSAHQQPPHRTVAGVASPGVAYVPAPTYQYSRDPGLPPYGKGYQPMPPALSQRVPSGEWDASGQFGAKPPPYYYPGASNHPGGRRTPAAMSVSNGRRRRDSGRLSVARHAVVSVVGGPAVILVVIMAPTMLTSSCLLFLLPPLALASEKCEERVNISFSSPHYLVFEFESSPHPDPHGLENLYALSSFFTSIVAPAGVPQALLESDIVEDPRKHIKDNLTRIIKNFPRLFTLAGVGLFLAFIVPALASIAFCCRCHCWCFASVCCGRCVPPEGPPDQPLRRNFCGLVLFLVIVVMLSALFCALVNNFYVSLGLNGLVSQANHTISDVKTLYQKTKREVDFVLVRNYNEFKADMFLKLESCIKATEDDFADIYEDTPFAGLSEVADRLGNATTTLRTAGGHVTDLNTLVSGMHALETRIRGHLGSAFAKCNTTPTNLPLSDCMKVKSVENVIVSGAPRGRDWFTQTLPRKTTYLAEVNRSVDEIRYVVETVGGNLEQISGRFNMPWGRHPDTLIKYRGKLENLLAELDEPLRRYLLAAYALLAVLACPVMVFLVGLCCGCCCAPTNGCCGRGCCGGCCLSCAAYFLAIAFGVSMTAAVPAMFAGHATQGSTCDVFEDLGGPTSRSLVQFVLAELRKRNIGVRGRSRVGTRLPLNHVSTETMMDIAKRFSQCGETPYSLFR